MKGATLTIPGVVRLTPTVRRRRWWRSWRLWVIVIDALLMAGVFAVRKWPLVKIRQIAIEGPSAWESKARSLVFLPSDSNLFSLDMDELQTRLQAEFGSLADCHAQLLLPDKLVIQISPTPLTLWTVGGQGVGVDGSILTAPAIERPAPIWRAPLGTYGDALNRQSRHAAGAWSQILDADGRFTNAVSELGCDSLSGWTMVGSDGRTRMNIGWSDLSEHASYVSALLARPDTILAGPCAIDARFDGQLIVSRLAMLEDSAAVKDSGKANPAHLKATVAARTETGVPKTTLGSPVKLAIGDSLGTVPASAKLRTPVRPNSPSKSSISRPSVSTKSTSSIKSTKSTKTKKPITHSRKHARKGGA